MSLMGLMGVRFPSNTLLMVHLGKRYNDLWQFNTQTRLWTALTTAVGPPARSSSCMDIDTVQSRLALFGGNNGVSYFNDLWVYSIAGSQWTQETLISGSIPAKGSGASAVDSQRSIFYVHGGAVSTALQDLWKYDFLFKQWTQVNAGTATSRIYGHTMKHLASQNALMIFGGYNLAYLNTIYQFTLASPASGWTLINPGTTKPAGSNFPSAGFTG